MDDLGTLQALRAVIPVWAVQTLVAYTVDELVTAIANSVVARVSAWVAKSIAQSRQ
jgi:hypothetical protein